MSSPLLEVKDLQVIVGEENKVLLDGLNRSAGASTQCHDKPARPAAPTNARLTCAHTLMLGHIDARDCCTGNA